MRKVLLIVALVMLSQTSYSMGDDALDQSQVDILGAQYCSPIVGYLKGMEVCPNQKPACIDADAEVVNIVENDEVTHCRIVISTNLQRIEGGSLGFYGVSQGKPEQTLATTLVESILNPNSLIFSHETIDPSKFTQYEFLKIYYNMGSATLVDAMRFNNVTEKMLVVTSGSDISGGIDVSPDQLGADLPGVKTIDDTGDTPTGGFGTLPPPAGSGAVKKDSKGTTSGAVEADAEGGIFSCQQISPTVPYHFSVEWFGLLTVLLVGLRQLLIAR